ncbi:MAG TPA: adenylate/guanylate cyclase domain-containing protein [Thermoplasmata archaeon]|jgi:adenylate cyclase|nr:adenylate/guanylate cyclase domain-containing protein [Thermoplasmata archaeon]
MHPSSVAPGRRLAAVMFTDTVGFTASTQANEGRTLELLRQQAELLRPLLALHQGREIKSTGDGFLVEFDSALKAVQCAMNIQRRIYERNSEGGQTPIRIRIGVHLGDVVQNGADILGDAVNIAARIEPLAEPGGVCVSSAVYDQVRTKIPDKFEKLPPKAMKGIQIPMEVYRVVFPWMNNGGGPAADDARVADKTRLAVLPFANISPDPSDEYFADGLTEELIANLSLVPGLKVIARTSVIGYKKTEKTVATIGKELGVGTVVEGSVRRSANRIRVTVQVIDVATEEHLWTAKYDDDLDDIFAVQSDIATKVATALPGGLQKERVAVPELEKPTETEAYLLYLQGQSLMWKTDQDSLRRSLEFFQKAIKTDPTFARAYAGMSQAYIGLGTEDFMPWVDACELGRAAAEKAMAIDPNLAEAHGLRAEIAFMADENADILDREVRRALELNPNSAQAHMILGALAGSLGIVEAYLDQTEQAFRLDPLFPTTIRSLGNAYFFSGRFDDALAHWKKTTERSPIDSYRGLADYYMLKGDFEQAESMVSELERIAPSSDFALLCRGFLAALRGDRATAMKAIQKLKETSKEGYARQSSVGFIYYALGDLDRFFEVMFVTAKAHTMQAARIRMSPLLAGARKDPRFVQLLSTYGRPVQAPQ